MTDEETVRCRKCRKILVTDLDCLLNAHGLKHQGGKADVDEEATECMTNSERSCLYISEESYPDFIADALDESSWTKGKLFCPGCQARIGSFNYISGSHCCCNSHIVPQVHFLVSKVDIRRKREALPNQISYPDHPVALSPADIESFPIIICADKGSQSQSASLPPSSTEGALQSCNDTIATTNKDTTQHVDQSESCELASECFTDASSESPRTRRKNLRRRRQLKRITDSLGDYESDDPAKSSNFQLLDSLEETSDEDDERPCEDIPLHLTCSVCLDLLYSPFEAKPCHHIFCEPCLRRLARRDPNKTTCPLCRQVIGQCMPAKDLTAEARTTFPQMYQERHQFELQHNIRHTPLPWIKNYRDDQGTQPRSLVEMAGGWRPVLWMLGINVFGFGSLALLKWYLKYQKNQMMNDIMGMMEGVHPHEGDALHF